MKSLFLLGSPYWCRYLETQFRKEGVEAQYIPHRSILRVFSNCDANLLLVGYGTRFSLKRVVIWLVIFTWWLARRRRENIFVYWIGTDAACPGTGSGGRLLVWLLNRVHARHLCGAPWFVEALLAHGIRAQPVLFPYDTSSALALAEYRPDPIPFRVLVYLTRGSWENMNGAKLLELARQTPELEWSVIGMLCSQVPEEQHIPPNMRFLGWVEDPLAVMSLSHVFIRLVDHDAYSGMVRDAQAMGKIVLYSKPLDGVIDISGKPIPEMADILVRISKGERDGQIDASIKAAENPLPLFSDQVKNLIRALELGERS